MRYRYKKNIKMDFDLESIKRNYILQVIYEILILLLPFFSSPYISRVIGVTGLGEFSFSRSVAYYFVLFSLLGINNYGNRSVAKSRYSQTELDYTFSSLFIVHAIASLFFSGFYIFFVMWHGTNKTYALIQFLYVFSAVFDVSWLYFGLEKFKTVIIRNAIVRMLAFASIFVFVKTTNDLWKYCLIVAGSDFLSQILLWVPINRYIHFSKPTKQMLAEHIRPLIVLFVPVIAIGLYKCMDKIMLGTLSSKAELGLYENAEKMYSVPMTLISSLSTIMLPKISNIVHNNKKEQETRYMDLSMQFVMWISIALACGICAVGKVFAPVFWGEEFKKSGIIMMGLALTIPFVSFASVLRTQYLIPHEKDKEYLRTVLLGAVINIFINLFLIPAYGSLGAVVGTIVTEILVCITQMMEVRNTIPIKKYLLNTIPFAICGIIMLFLVYQIGSYSVSIRILVIQVTIGIVIYCFLSFAYMYYTKNEFFGIISQLWIKRWK